MLLGSVPVLSGVLRLDTRRIRERTENVTSRRIVRAQENIEKSKSQINVLSR
jgi:hypothetical protein